MLPNFAAKFALTSLRLFKHGGRFEIDIPPCFDLEDIAREYESYGHAVERQTKNHRITVVCAA